MKEEETADKFFEKGKTEFANAEYLQSIHSLTYAGQLYEALNRTDLVAETLIYIGKAYVKIEEIEKGIDNLEEALFKLRLTEKKEKLGDCALVIGLFYRDVMKTIPKSKEYFQEAIKAYSSLNNNEKLGDAWNALATARIKNPKKIFEDNKDIQSDLKNALECYNDSKNKEKKAEVEYKLGEIFLKQAKYQETEVHLLNAYRYYKTKKREPMFFPLLIKLIQVYLRLEKKDLAKKYYLEAEKRMREMDYDPHRLQKLQKYFKY